MLNISFRTTLAVCALSFSLTGCVTNGMGNSTARPVIENPNRPATASTILQDKPLPSFIVSNEPAPEVIYRRGSRDTILADTDMPLKAYNRFDNRAKVETLVTRKANELERDLRNLQRQTKNYDSRLTTLQTRSDSQAGEYYSFVAAINAQLQSGSTPGNPVLIEKWNAAQDKLAALSVSSGRLNEIATDLTSEASRAAFLLESIRSAFTLSGAVEHDHERLRALEDETNQNIVHINRLLNQVSDEINRRATYLRSERLNMQTLSLAIANGELYGHNLTNTLFKRAAEEGGFISQPEAQRQAAAQPTARRPLVIIRFDRKNVNYEQALYTAIGQALEKYPAARFDLVAISPIVSGNAAQTALAGTDARKNGEAVLRSMTQMGLPLERVRLSAAQSRDVQNGEVHLYVQ